MAGFKPALGDVDDAFRRHGHRAAGVRVFVDDRCVPVLVHFQDGAVVVLRDPHAAVVHAEDAVGVIAGAAPRHLPLLPSRDDTGDGPHGVRLRHRIADWTAAAVAARLSTGGGSGARRSRRRLAFREHVRFACVLRSLHSRSCASSGRRLTCERHLPNENDCRDKTSGGADEETCAHALPSNREGSFLKARSGLVNVIVCSDPRDRMRATESFRPKCLRDSRHSDVCSISVARGVALALAHPCP
jgi:hypothetical protein